MTLQDRALDLLVVEDNPVLASVLFEIFRDCGHEVRMASDGFTALAEMRKRVPDILLSDLSMPGMSGYELLSVVRRRFPAIRVIAMSGEHRGGCVPPGVAADAFYAKGESSVAHLIHIASSIWREDAPISRNSAPIWISEVTLASAGKPLPLASCPECLRPFSRYSINNAMQRSKETCPHCKIPVELAFVREYGQVDQTMHQGGSLRPPARRNTGAPSGRMYRA